MNDATCGKSVNATPISLNAEALFLRLFWCYYYAPFPAFRMTGMLVENVFNNIERKPQRLECMFFFTYSQMCALEINSEAWCISECTPIGNSSWKTPWLRIWRTASLLYLVWLQLSLEMQMWWTGGGSAKRVRTPAYISFSTQHPVVARSVEWVWMYTTSRWLPNLYEIFQLHIKLYTLLAVWVNCW